MATEKKLFVGNLSYNMTNEELKELFESCGEVISAHVITDRETRRSKGFGFVEMSSPEEAQKAIDDLHEREENGRAMIVNEAKPRAENPNRGGRRG